MLEVVDEVPGSSELLKWFGHGPLFTMPSYKEGNYNELTVPQSAHAFETTNKGGKPGPFRMRQTCCVGFLLEEIKNLDVNYFNG